VQDGHFPAVDTISHAPRPNLVLIAGAHTGVSEEGLYDECMTLASSKMKRGAASLQSGCGRSDTRQKVKLDLHSNVKKKLVRPCKEERFTLQFSLVQ